MKRTIDARALRAQLELDHPILMRPLTTDPDVLREMVARGKPDRRQTMRPGPDRRKADQ